MSIATASRYHVALFAVVTMLTGCGESHSASGVVPTTSSASSAASGSRTFHYTGGEQSFTVAKGVMKLTVVARGASGVGSGPAGSGPGSVGGNGGRVYAIIPVTPGEKLRVFVGGAGLRHAGGFNGGANGRGRHCGSCTGAGAGGVSDIRLGGDTLSDRILVAGGGGGGGGPWQPSSSGDPNPANGGKGGGIVGGSGGFASGGLGGGGGLGGTQSKGGAGGAGGYGQFRRDRGFKGKTGSLGDGGTGGAPGGGYSDSGGGGGGGGGYYGGGGGGGGGSFTSVGSSGGGGGGGSSYVEPSANNVHMWQGWKNATGNGLVVFSWQ